MTRANLSKLKKLDLDMRRWSMDFDRRWAKAERDRKAFAKSLSDPKVSDREWEKLKRRAGIRTAGASRRKPT